jgi:hypothetical protein
MTDQYQTNGSRFRKKFGFFMPVLVVMGLLFFGFLVMQLWNAILPEVAPVKPLSFWQATGLLILCRILFGGFGGGRGGWMGRQGYPGKGPGRKKWMEMSEEERVTFRQEWRKRCGRPMPEDEQKNSGQA